MAEGTNVAVLRTGIMGAAMARNLLSAGMEVRAWNRSRGKAEPLKVGGAEVAEAQAVAARFDEAIQAGHGEEDMAAVYRAAKV